MTLQPDEEVPRRLEQAERVLAGQPRRWLARATAVLAVGAGWTLLLPWSYGSRSGLRVWHLGYAEQPALCALWALGTATAVVGLRFGRRLPAAAGAVLALAFTGWAWRTDPLATDSWTGPGQSLAVLTGLLWLLAAIGQLLAGRAILDEGAEPPIFTEYALREATGRLRRTRDQRPTEQPRIHPPE